LDHAHGVGRSGSLADALLQLSAMANFVKTKVSISVICASVLLLLPLLYNNFNAPPAFTRWGEPITWDSFAGVPRIFSKYDASIHSTIYLGYDSAAEQYYAYAAQNNNYSWARPSIRDSVHAYLLGHEQYHFNISEIHARLLNNFIRANPGREEIDYKLKLYALQRELDDMQDKYDEESAHSLNIDLQRWWEYRIDSLLQVHAGDSGMVTDYYSGGQAFFPVRPVQDAGSNSSNIPYRYSSIGKYGMTMHSLVYQQLNYESDVASVESYARALYSTLETPVQSITVQSGSNNDFVLKIVADDTLNQKRLYDLWTVRPPYLFQVRAEIPKLEKDTIGYYRIAQSFLSSFKVVNTDQHWRSLLDEDSARVTIVPMVTVKKPDNYISETCYNIVAGAVHGFYRGPIRYNDQWLIAYDITDEPDSVVQDHALYVNSKLITFKDSGPDVLYVIPKDEQPKRPYTVAVGYILRSDTAAGCRIMHNQKIQVE